MKKLFVFLFVITSFITKAQNYQPFVSSKTYMYTFDMKSPYSYVGISFDSVKVIENDSILYPTKMLTVDTSMMNVNSSWIGNKVILQENGDAVFNNFLKEKILIKTQANLNDTWTVISTDSVEVTAEVISVKNENIYEDVFDNVKTIELVIQDKALNQVSNDTIKLSQNYGMSQLYSFISLTGGGAGNNSVLNAVGLCYVMHPTSKLIGISNMGGTQNFTWLDVFNFNVGDVYHFTESETKEHPFPDFDYNQGGNYVFHYVSGKINKRILEASKFADSSIYKVEITKEVRVVCELDNSVNQTMTIDTVIEKYYNDSLFNVAPGVPSKQLWGEFIIYNYLNDSVKYCPTRPEEAYVIKENGQVVYGSGWSDGLCGDLRYIKGFGGPYKECDGSWSPYNDFKNKLVYYKKDGVEWGIKNVITATVDVEIASSPVIFENNTLQIDSSIQGNFTVQVYDILGRVVEQGVVYDNTYKLTNYNKGLLFYVIYDSGVEMYSGKILKTY